MTEPIAAPRRPRVLIVDDERRNRQLLEIMLGEEGYDLSCASDGSEAVEMATRDRPDIILLDVMMPGMNGYEVAARLKAADATSDIPLVIISALDDENSRQHGVNAGAEGFVSKPVNRQEVISCVRSLLDRGRK